jgi:hypothetical protein
MPDVKTSQETTAAAIGDSDYFRGVQGAGNVKFFYSQIKTWIRSWINFSDLSGDLDVTQLPALTGDVTTTGGTVATTIAGHAVGNSKLAQMAAATLKGNPTASTADAADFTIHGLSTLGSPDASLDFLLIEDHATGTLKRVAPGAVAGSNTSGLSSLNGASGAVTIAGAGVSGTTIYTPQSGFANRLRNSSLTSWFHGFASRSITTSGDWGAEGIYVVPTGASVTVQQVTSTLSNPRSYFAQKITGAASVTGLVNRFVVESFDAAPLAGQQVTFQLPVRNDTGSTITPTITVKRCGAQDSTYTNVDVSAVALQSIANGATGVLAYSWALNAGANLGFCIDIDFGNNFSTTGKSIQIGGGFDCRATPGVSTGTVASPPTPEIPHASVDAAWNERFYQTSYDNGTAPGASTANGLTGAVTTANAGSNFGALAVPFRNPMRAAPSISWWDRVGNASKSSAYNGSWNDNIGGLTQLALSTRGWLFFSNGGNYCSLHFAADATLVGA